ncbi:MAG: sugar kinase, partial [Pseudomonadota bacterium]
NCAIAASRSGARVGYLTRLGDDTFADDFLELWRRESIDSAHVRKETGTQTGIYFITHTEEGHSFSYRRAGSAASRLEPTDIPERYVAGARVLHVSGISQAISDTAADAVFHAIDVARAGGTLVSFDPNLRLSLWSLSRARAAIHSAMEDCDIALPGYDDAVKLTGRENPDAIADFYLNLGARVVALTLGEQGTLVAAPEQRERVPALSIVPVDATGAGDTFDGAFLAEYLRSGDPFAAARYANTAAGLSTRGWGAIAPIPTRGEVEAVLQDKPERRLAASPS